ncbi:serine/threonine protein kinase [uncultured Zoogloea sp.]|uniref:serine/threonine protein kinase n=1 Tax=uncultured Zoogloea sp. TaxID=160237 RepID=UPI00260FC944|nr:serine/threonine protein kinase [uncultured Zoogloea sp.]
MTAPFGPLTPDFVLSAVEASGLVCDGRLLTLNSYENRVYQVGIEDAQPLIAKFYRPGRWSDEAILEEHAFLAELADAEIPAVPALEVGGSTLHHYEGFRVALFPRRGGRAPELDDPAVLGWLGRFLGRIHAIGANKPFAHRPDLTIRSFGEEPRDELLASPFLPSELRETWRSVVDQALDGVRRCFERAGAQPMIRLHGDVHGGNVLWTDAGPHFVDFDDARNGPAVQDLWMLLSGDAPAMARQLDHVLEGYEQFADFDPVSLHLVEALRTLRLIHYAGWIARRWDDPAFPAAFSWFDTPRYWQDMILSLREQVALMDESPLARQF